MRLVFMSVVFVLGLFGCCCFFGGGGVCGGGGLVFFLSFSMVFFLSEFRTLYSENDRRAQLPTVCRLFTQYSKYIDRTETRRAAGYDVYFPLLCRSREYGF